MEKIKTHDKNEYEIMCDILGIRFSSYIKYNRELYFRASNDLCILKETDLAYCREFYTIIDISDFITCDSLKVIKYDDKSFVKFINLS